MIVEEVEVLGEAGAPHVIVREETRAVEALHEIRLSWNERQVSE